MQILLTDEEKTFLRWLCHEFQAQKTIKRKMVRFFEQGFNSYPNGCKFLGFHVIRFERDSFISGKCFLDDKEVTEKELIEFLSMGVK